MSRKMYVTGYTYICTCDAHLPLFHRTHSATEAGTGYTNCSWEWVLTIDLPASTLCFDMFILQFCFLQSCKNITPLLWHKKQAPALDVKKVIRATTALPLIIVVCACAAGQRRESSFWYTRSRSRAVWSGQNLQKGRNRSSGKRVIQGQSVRV